MSTEDDSRVKQLVEQVSNGVRQLEAQVLQLKEMIQSLQEESNKKPPDQNLLGKYDSLCAQMRTILLEQQQPEKKSMRIFVKTPLRKLTFNVESSDTIYTVQKEVERRVIYALHRVRLVYEGKKLDDGMTFADYNVENDSTIGLAFEKDLSTYN